MLKNGTGKFSAYLTLVVEAPKSKFLTVGRDAEHDRVLLPSQLPLLG
jgi:hypothetical protein